MPILLDALTVAPSDESCGGLDDLTAEEVLLGRGMSRELYDAFVRPVLQALLFRPPAELSALVTLRVLWCYVFKQQASFDVRWFRGPLDDLLTRPLVAEIERLGGTVEAGMRLKDLEVGDRGKAVAATLANAEGQQERVPISAVVIAAGGGGTRRTLEACGERLQGQLGVDLLDGLKGLQATECTAVRFALDRRCPTAFASNVLSGIDGLEETGATYFMLDQLQPAFLRKYAASTPGGTLLRDCSIVGMDFYGSDRGPLATMGNDDFAEFALSALRKAEPRAFHGAKLKDGVEVSVLRAPNAATHFAPGSRRLRPRQETAVPNLFLAGDFVKGLEHGAEGLSQERALVSGYSAANLAIDACGGSRPRQKILQLADDEPQIALLKEAWRAWQ